MINNDKIRAAEKCLIDNGIEPDEANTVLQAIGYILLDTELYPVDYQDRSIIGTVFEDSEELGREEAYSLGYVKEGELTERYFDFEKFGEDLIEEEMYQELESGKCVMYMM